MAATGVSTPVGTGGPSGLPAPRYDWANGQVLEIGSGSTPSAAIASDLVLVSSDQACWIAVGADPTAAADTAGSLYLPADTMFEFAITSGHKIAVIQDAAAGHLSILPGLMVA